MSSREDSPQVVPGDFACFRPHRRSFVHVQAVRGPTPLRRSITGKRNVRGSLFASASLESKPF
jgi:hypothetical protein